MDVRTYAQYKYMNTIYEQRSDFAAQVRHYRTQQHWTVNQLSKKAGMCPALISSIEQGDRNISFQAGLKLAEAFQLKGTTRDDFLFKAATTRKKDRLMAYARELPAEIINFVVRRLVRAGVDLKSISSSQYQDQGDTESLEIDLKNGKKIICSLSLAV
jgi:transcriptional regulator with XRE-family HTH domain